MKQEEMECTNQLLDTYPAKQHDLRHEVCIQALTIGSDQAGQGSVEWLGLVETFARSEQLATVVHASPGTRVAQIELLLGLCYATGVYPRTHTEWREWNDSRRPLTDVAERLASAEFDGLLDPLHPEHPFGQNALLADHLDPHGYGPAQLGLERCADYNQFADHRHLFDGPLPMREAVLAMLTQHHYGLGGRVRAKTSWLGRSFTFGSVGRLAGRVRTLALGRTLADTLRLNLAPHRPPPGEDFGGFNFSWTRGSVQRRTFDGATAQMRRAVVRPGDLHSVLGRSVLLRAGRSVEGEWVVDRVLMGAGELLEPLGADGLQDAVMDSGRPLQASAEHGLWRDAHALYAACRPHTKGNDLFSRLASLKRPITLWSVGLVAKQRSAITWVSDTFPFDPKSQPALLRVSREAAAWTDFLASCVEKAAIVARDVVYPQARPDERKVLLKRFHPGSLLFARFEGPFHELLDDIAAGVAAETALACFAEHAVHASRAALRERLRGLPRSATALEAEARAEARFEAALNATNTFPLLKEAAHP
ncbi:type I-E CRISPR-associated protein Cse1/CasA [Streptomyces noursei]|uniref:type I-E CRISPR-associated protein Cse1/CasA n=1 Tax=Streptomyces noursei TaxID=1971 RepID=UPI00382C4909